MTVGNSVTRFVYDGENVAAEFTDSDGDGDIDQRRYYWILPQIDQSIGFCDVDGQGNASWYYYLTDQVGSSTAVVDAAGTVVNRYDYDAFGNLIEENSFENVPNRYRFHGREWDAHRGEYYYRYRNYIPEWGQFATLDRDVRPAEAEGACNDLFCGNDPVGLTDPMGLAWWNPVDWFDTAPQKRIPGVGRAGQKVLALQDRLDVIPGQHMLQEINAAGLHYVRAHGQGSMASWAVGVGAFNDQMFNLVEGLKPHRVAEGIAHDYYQDTLLRRDDPMTGLNAAVLATGRRMPLISSVIGGTEMAGGQRLSGGIGQNLTGMDHFTRSCGIVADVAMVGVVAKVVLPPKSVNIPGAYLNKRVSVDMRGAPTSSLLNALGFPRNGPWFWRQMLRKHPEMFSAENQALIKKGLAPVVDEPWCRYNPAHQSFMGEILVHHHVMQGPWAVGLPEVLHKAWDRFLHPFKGMTE